MKIIIGPSLLTKYILDISSSSMDARYVAMCFFLIIGLNGTPTSAGLCSYLYLFHQVGIHWFISFKKLSVEYLWQFYGYFIVIKINWDYNLLMCVVIFAETCWQYVKVQPFCFKAICNTNCYIESKSQGVNLGGIPLWWTWNLWLVPLSFL
jgi:hypothetical protein